MRRFSLYNRGKIYYVRFYNPDTKKYCAGRSTGESERDLALAHVYHLLKYPQPEVGQMSIDERMQIDTVLHTVRHAPLQPEHVESILHALKERGLINSASVRSSGVASEPLVAFLKRFWDYDDSEYVKEKLAYGHSIGRTHCRDSLGRILHWKEFFGEEATVGSVTRDQLREFQLLIRKKLAPKTVNLVVHVGALPFNWLHERGDIAENPAEGLRKFSGKPAERGILSKDEVRSLFKVAWNDERALVGNLIAASTGARSGEVVALQIQDVGEDRLHIRRSWSRHDKLKSTKNGDERAVPLMPDVRRAILRLAASNPHPGGDERFLFYSERPDTPMSQNILRRGLDNALIAMSLSSEELKSPEKRSKALQAFRDRNIAFHSWRHAFATHLADRVDMRKVQLATGHRSESMARHYAAHTGEADFQVVAQAATTAFEDLFGASRKPEKIVKAAAN